MYENKFNKIVIVSFQRNATQSLSRLLDRNGLHGIHHITEREHSDNFKDLNFNEILSRIEKYEEEYVHFADSPYFMMYEYFDKKYPDSKFILVERDSKEWVNSFKKLYKLVPVDPVSIACVAKYIDNFYTIENVSDEILIKMYETHNNKVKDYFKDKNNLLVLNIKDLDIIKISNFLGIKLQGKITKIDFLKSIINK